MGVSAALASGGLGRGGIRPSLFYFVLLLILIVIHSRILRKS